MVRKEKNKKTDDQLSKGKELNGEKQADIGLPEKMNLELKGHPTWKVS